MAVSELEVKFRWENDNFFEMTRKVDAEDVQTIIKAEEQGNLASLWPHIEKICIGTITQDMKTIGEKML